MEINTQNKRRVSTKIDLTAMVDLGFLLITFFMLATSFAHPKVMEVLKPDETATVDVPLSKVATILIGPDDQLYGYTLPDVIEDESDILIDTLNYSPQSLRKFILDKQAAVELRHGSAEQLFLLIKPMENSSYSRLVDVLDEVLITQLDRYAIVEPNAMVDSMIIKKLK
jgi:biopolymer transport protein ExbD